MGSIKNENDNDELCDKNTNDSDNKDKSKKNKKKDNKKKENKKKETVYIDPIYTFRGNQIDEIKKYILKNTSIDEKLIKL